MYLAKVLVQFKQTVSDPQGRTIEGGLKQLGFDTVRGVRAGKYITVRLDEPDEASAADKVREMCDKLLANPVIEEYRFELEEVAGGP